MQGPFRNISPDGRINQRSLKRNGEYLGSLFALDAPDGFTFDQGATGTSLIDQRPKRRLAIVQSTYGSGSGASGSGLSRTGLQVAADMLNAYYVKFAMWVNENDTFVVTEIPEQPNVLAIEANGVTDVPDGAIVEVLPGIGQPDFYYFWWTGELDSGSGNDAEYTTTCPDGTSYKIRIDGNTVTVTEV